MKIVADTNVLVSGILSAEGPPGKIVDMIMMGELQVCYSPKIFAEYESVLRRPELFLPDRTTANLLAQIVSAGESVDATAFAPQLPDPSDEVFLEVSLASGADCIITGNLKHFPPSCRQGIRVVSPREFLEFYRAQQDGSSGTVKSPSATYKSKRSRKKKRSR